MCISEYPLSSKTPCRCSILIGLEFMNRFLFVGFLNNLMLGFLVGLFVLFSGVLEVCGKGFAISYASLSPDGGDVEGVVYFWSISPSEKLRVEFAEGSASIGFIRSMQCSHLIPPTTGLVFVQILHVWQ